MPIGSFLKKIPAAFGINEAPYPVTTPPFIGDSYGSPDDDAGAPVPPSGPAAAPPALSTPQQAPPPLPSLDPDTQKYLELARQGAPMHPKHSTLRNVGESLAGAFIGDNLSQKIFDPTYARQKAEYQHALQNAALPSEIYQKGTANAANTAHVYAQAKLGNEQANNFGANQTLAAIEHGGELEPDQPQGQGAPPPLSTPGQPAPTPAPSREGSTVNVAGRKVFFPSKRTIAAEAKDAAKTEEVTPEMEAAAAEFKLPGFPKAGTKVTPTQWNNLQTTIRDLQVQKNRPEKQVASPDEVLLNPGKFTPEQVQKAQEMFNAAHRPPSNDHGVTMIGGDGKVYRLQPGQQVPEGAQTAAGLSSVNTPTSQTRSMTEVAPKVIGFVDRINGLIDQQEKNLGPGSSRVREFFAGKVGAGDPAYTQLRTDIGLLQTALMRMHVGARGGEQMMEHFRSLIDASKQSPENLRAALGEIKAYAESVASHGTPDNAGNSGGNANKTVDDLVKKYGGR